MFRKSLLALLIGIFAVAGVVTAAVASGVSHKAKAVKATAGTDPVLLGDTAVEKTADSNGAKNAQAWVYTAATTGSATDVELYVGTNNTATKLFVGLYSTASSKPSVLLATGSESKVTKGGWNDITIASAKVTAGTKYALAVLGTGGTAGFKDNKAGSCNTWTSSSSSLTALSAKWATGTQWNGYCPASFYVNGTTITPPPVTTTSTTTTTPPVTTTTTSTTITPPPVTTSTTTTSTTTITPPPNNGSCTGAKSTPGGADPWGGCFPGPNNTGVPAGTSLTTISSGQSGTGWKDGGGELDITQCGVTLNAVKISDNVIVTTGASNGTHSASTPCVTISNSEIDAFVQVENTDGSDVGGPLILTDDTVNTPKANDDRSPVLSANYFATGVNVEGARLGFSCQKGPCSVTDSYAHAGFLEGEFHYNAFGSNGATGMTITHDTLACDFSNTDQTAINNGAGCSDDVGLFPDFAPIQDVSISKNLFVSDAQSFGGVPFCIDAGYGTTKPFVNQTSDISVTDNVFQRGTPPGNGGTNACGLFGPVYNWPSPTPAGSVWSGNAYDDGTPINEG